jgi:hypothetical protein
MSTEITVQKKELPSISDLYDVSNIELAFKKDQFNLLMNQNPEPKWILENRFAGNSKYMPIGIIETLLQRIFKEFRVEVLREGTMFNSVYVAVRLHYLHPITAKWGYHDGLGACQIQTKQGASPADLQSINNNAVMMALPMAKSYAIKDCADHFGKLFGRDLNRKDTMGFGVDSSLDQDTVFNEICGWFQSKKDKIPSQDYANIQRVIDNKEKTSYNKIHKLLKNL